VWPDLKSQTLRSKEITQLCPRASESGCLKRAVERGALTADQEQAGRLPLLGPFIRIEARRVSRESALVLPMLAQRRVSLIRLARALLGAELLRTHGDIASAGDSLARAALALALFVSSGDSARRR